jgi:hypothetical protein
MQTDQIPIGGYAHQRTGWPLTWRCHRIPFGFDGHPDAGGIVPGDYNHSLLVETERQMMSGEES